MMWYWGCDKDRKGTGMGTRRQTGVLSDLRERRSETVNGGREGGLGWLTEGGVAGKVVGCGARVTGIGLCGGSGGGGGWVGLLHDAVLFAMVVLSHSHK